MDKDPLNSHIQSSSAFGGVPARPISSWTRDELAEGFERNRTKYENNTNGENNTKMSKKAAAQAADSTNMIVKEDRRRAVRTPSWADRDIPPSQRGDAIRTFSDDDMINAWNRNMARTASSNPLSRAVGADSLNIINKEDRRRARGGK
jgi:hypothetical protein